MLLVLGDIVLDNNITGLTNRIAPESCIPIVNVKKQETFLGCSGNIILNLVDFFEEIKLITCLNIEGSGKIRNFFDKIPKIKYKNFPQKDKELIIKNRLFSRDTLISRFDNENIKEINNENIEKIIKYIEEIIKELKIVIISDYNKGFFNKLFLSKLINICNLNNVITLVDPKGLDYEKYKGCTLIKPNKKEAQDYFREIINNNNRLNFSNSLIKQKKIKYILNTLGEEGMILYYEDKFIEKKIIPSSVIDVTGCGDTIISSIAIYLSKNNFKLFDYKKFLDILSIIGSKAVTTKGCYHLKKEDWPYEEKIIFTNGCFDIVHIGHLKLFNECKKLGKLIIGLNSDISIKKLKGANRPINNENDRKSFLEELNIADEIIIFNEETPYNLIKKIKPDILVKGGDYKKENIVGRELVKEIKIIDYLKSYSTTKIINKIINKNVS